MIVYIELQISLALSCMLLTMNHETDEENEYLVPLQTLYSLRCIGMNLDKDIEDWVDCHQVLIEEEGDNILHLACDRGWCGVVREVIQHRKEDIINVLSTPSDPELPQSPLMIAASRGQVQIMELLLQHPDINVDLVEENTSTRWTAMHWVVNYFTEIEEERKEIGLRMMKMLVLHGARVDHNFLCFVASRAGTGELIQYLVEEAGCRVTPDVLVNVRKHNPGSLGLCEERMGTPLRLLEQARATIRKILVKATNEQRSQQIKIRLQGIELLFIDSLNLKQCQLEQTLIQVLSFHQRIGTLVADCNLPTSLLSFILCDTSLSEARLMEMFPNLHQESVKYYIKDENFNTIEEATTTSAADVVCEGNPFTDVKLALDFVVSLEDEYPKQRRRGRAVRGAVGVARELFQDAVLHQIILMAVDLFIFCM